MGKMELGFWPPEASILEAKVQGCSSWNLLLHWSSSLPDAHFLGLLFVCIFVMVTFSTLNLCVLHLCRKMLLQVSFTLKLWNPKQPPIPLATPLHTIKRLRHVYYLQLYSTFPKLVLYREQFYASYNKPALHINAHFQCMWHFKQRG